MEDLWESIRLSFEGEHDVHYSSLKNLDLLKFKNKQNFNDNMEELTVN